ncbi:unnamed protein product [Dovyalis caffra]|uniref:Uncharacterized protein n=1 Tax=Dovyalis caffra TaxID=77055 RepID=A0AAV1SC05_9ROSI|nr:unnamed protein product [Dovyalis caffra]
MTQTRNNNNNDDDDDDDNWGSAVKYGKNSGSTTTEDSHGIIPIKGGPWINQLHSIELKDAIASPAVIIPIKGGPRID